MGKHFHIALFLCSIILSSCTAYPPAMIPSAARLSGKEYRTAVRRESSARYDKKIKDYNDKQKSGQNFSAWSEVRRAESMKLPARERSSYMKNSTAKWVDSTLISKCFRMESWSGMQFGNSQNRRDLYGVFKVLDTVLYCSFRQPLHFRSEHFDYKMTRVQNKIEIDIRVYRTTATELSDNPFEVLIKLRVSPNREAELIISSPDGKTTHVHCFGLIGPGIKGDIPYYDRFFMDGYY